MLERDRRVAIGQRDRMYARGHSGQALGRHGADARHGLSRRVQQKPGTHFEQAQYVRRREVVFVVVAHEHGVQAVERRRAGEERAFGCRWHQSVLPEVVAEQRIEHDAGVAVRHEHAGVGEIVRRGGALACLLAGGGAVRDGDGRYRRDHDADMDARAQAGRHPHTLLQGGIGAAVRPRRSRCRPAYCDTGTSRAKNVTFWSPT